MFSSGQLMYVGAAAGASAHSVHTTHTHTTLTYTLIHTFTYKDIYTHSHI